MAEVVRDEDSGELFVRGRGAQLIPITEDQVRTAQESSLEAFLGAAGETLAEPMVGMGVLMGTPGARETLGEIGGRREARGLANPMSGGAGSIAGELVNALPGGIAGAAGRGFVSGAVRGGIAEGANQGFLGAVTQPDDPLAGALMRGGIGALGGMAAGGIAGGLTRRFSGTADEVIARSRARAQAGAGRLDDGLQGAPGSIMGTGPAQVNAARGAGLTARLSSIFSDRSPPNHRTLADAERLGIKLSPADRSGNIAQKNLESSMMRNPAGQAVFEREIMRPNQELLNELAGRAAGIDNVNGGISPQRLGMNVDRIKAGFEDAARKIGDVEINRERVTLEAVKPDMLPETVDRLRRVLDKVPERVDGERGFEYISRMRERSAEFQGRGQVEYAEALEDIASAVEDQMLATAARRGQFEVADQLGELRNQWKAQRLLERGSVLTEEGDVSMAAIRQAFRSDRHVAAAYRRGDGFGSDTFDDLGDAVRVLSQFRERIGNSGTPTGLTNWTDPRTYLAAPLAEGYLNRFDRALLQGGAGAAGVAAVGSAGAGALGG